jgi:hypothetical protein
MSRQASVASFQEWQFATIAAREMAKWGGYRGLIHDKHTLETVKVLRPAGDRRDICI